MRSTAGKCRAPACDRDGAEAESRCAARLESAGRQPATEMERRRNRGAQHGWKVQGASPRLIWNTGKDAFRDES
ncbi:hypothetical protein B5F86_13730 [Lachnoclostridium sp. An298]|nr:hypothetical protein B5F86_13730 [Lachnoclostridium sp. An298]